MKDETILLLTYNYDSNLKNHPSLKYVKNRCGVYLPWNLYVFEPLQKIFSKVILYDYLERRAEIGVNALNEEIIELVRKEHPQYVLWTSFYFDIFESTFDVIRNEGARVVGLFFDDEWRFDTYSKWWIPNLDFVVTNAREAVPKYKELDARVILTIPNTGINVDRDTVNHQEKYDVSFVGSRFYADRDIWISELKKRNVPIHLFGTGWSMYISFEEMLDIFSTSKINLNFSKFNYKFSKTVADLKKLQIKGRIFQVCLAGGFLLTEYAPGIEDYFEIDKEIVCFLNTDELINKIDYYLNHDNERRRIAEAGWNRAIREYSSSSMIAKVFQEIEEKAAMKDIKINPLRRKMEMPKQTRKDASQYNFEWGMALLEENHKGLWKDDFALSISYNPFNVGSWFYYAVGYLPHPICIKIKNLEKRFRAFYRRLHHIKYQKNCSVEKLNDKKL